MKRNLRKILVACLAGVLMLGASSVFAVDTKISMEVWARHQATIQQDRSKNVATNMFSENATWIERGYLTINPKLSDQLSLRFTFDMNGGKGESWVKYAYLQYAVPAVSDLTLYAGMVKTYFGTIDPWGYLIFDKDLADHAKVVSTANNGFAAYYLLPMGFGALSASVVNGEDYKSTGTVLKAASVNPQYIINGFVTPIAGVKVGGSASHHKLGTLGKETNNTAYMAYATLAFGPAELWLQYISQERQRAVDVEIYRLSAWYRAMLIFDMTTLELPLSLVACIDFDNVKARSDSFADRIDGKTRATVAANYEFGPGVVFQLNYQRVMPESRAKNATTFYVKEDNYGITDTIVAQLKIKFDFAAK